MHQLDRMTYFTANNATGVALPYADEKFAYFALLPEKQMTPREWLAEQDQSLFADIAGMMAQKPEFTVQLAMPKFEAHYDDSLLYELTRLGMGIALTGRGSHPLYDTTWPGRTTRYLCGVPFSDVREKAAHATTAYAAEVNFF
ncbi:MAG: serpin family protein [Syntrophaceticus sp.]|nr:serpin family protein [Syntrophaceticus sp.]MDD3314024.1 serpin family protein [Syntrophaceticus sp.]MDD4782263.1 serpin family protein [Syntrophaceticus sp.]